MDDVMAFDSKLHDSLRERPGEVMPVLERAAREVRATLLFALSSLLSPSLPRSALAAPSARQRSAPRCLSSS
eukprot:2249572-Rhodomonas_salina.1